jgi:NADH-quinone oxidoreductase subunit I
MPWEDWSDLADVEDDTSAWMRATAPGGAAEFEGIVAWAGELGFGTRAPEQGQSVTVVDDEPAETTRRQRRNKRKAAGATDAATPAHPEDENEATVDAAKENEH